MWRCEQIRQRYDADVYIQIHRQHKHYEYTSSNEPSCPKSKDELSRAHPVPVTRCPRDFATRKSTISSKRLPTISLRPENISAHKNDSAFGSENRSLKVTSFKAQGQYCGVFI
ncbi:hypothetical protein CH63R_10617 [Colletotrichum higginsianum IMI 349063]|uniref:Uncharacterized protein n=1 Tax=Colletotrichum higginsianum (strain IMI 349063) TaxID=759273 RepID=A0A1B7Y387_COLHI|nr:uncharacterized protein CH63R_10617 [Colletotrichum higginsianum IMI 349063]OBR06497.1 hypothetical protein CH63R_10617 [Colletotrichum higginsianum IMI 349063]